MTCQALRVLRIQEQLLMQLMSALTLQAQAMIMIIAPEYARVWRLALLPGQAQQHAFLLLIHLNIITGSAAEALAISAAVMILMIISEILLMGTVAAVAQILQQAQMHSVRIIMTGAWMEVIVRNNRR